MEKRPDAFPRDSETTRQVPTAGDRMDVDPESVRLWDPLERARADDDPGALAAAEDGVFRFTSRWVIPPQGPLLDPPGAALVTAPGGFTLGRCWSSRSMRSVRSVVVVVNFHSNGFAAWS